MKRGTGLFYIWIAASTSGSSFGFTRTINSVATTFLERMMSSGTANTSSSSDDQSWRSLMEVSIAKSRKIRGSNYVQFSTVEEGEPRCRTVVFRGWQKVSEDHKLYHEVDSKSCLMKMCTDRRSKKVSQNDKQDITEIVWWFPKSSEQYRIRGPLILIGGENDDRTLEIARKELWGNISDPARESFLGSVVPGDVYEADSSDIPAGGRDEHGKVLPPPDNFLLMLLDPTEVDYLRLTGDQYRQLDSRGPSSWSSKRVNP